MNARTIRRAQERQTRKELAREARQDGTAAAEEETVAAQADTPSAQRLAANRENAQLSTGPKTAEGKAKSSLNAVKTGLTGRTVLLPGDDAALYSSHLAAFFDELEPGSIQERALVQSLADNAWRSERIPALEMAIFAQGRHQFANHFDHLSEAARPGMIEMHTFLHYEKQLRNLQLQEARLRRQREKDMAELRQLQKDRIAAEKRALEVAAKLYLAAQHDGQPFVPEHHGFEFSIADIESYLDGVRAAHLAQARLREERNAALNLSLAA